MDADAKGQVGGLDVGEEVRRRYAVESRRWVCEVCEGGRTNEEVLRGWREVCREKGVVVDDDEAATIADERGRGAEANAEPEPADPAANTETASSQRESESLARRDGAPPPQVPVPVPSLSSASESASASASAPAPAPTPTRTTPVQTTTTTTTTTTSRPTTSDAPWLDRAILGVLVALAFMILRRFAKSEEY